METGPALFARYAYGPNCLGYCGPDRSAELFGEATQAASQSDQRVLRELAAGFEGAFPYLQLIASANGLPDPLDRRVVEAYWIGNDLLTHVPPNAFGESLTERFRCRLGHDSWRWLATKPGDGALPTHAFHVLDVYPRLGLMRSGSLDGVLEMIDKCRIRWGTVLERHGDWLVVSALSLGMVDGKLAFLPARVERVQAWRGGAGFIDDPKPGSAVSMHWDWACEVLTDRRLQALQAWTAYEMEIANKTI